MIPDLDDRFQQLVQRQAAAWNAGDGAAWASCFSADATFVNIMGMTLCGREEIAERHAMMFRTVFADSQCRADVVHSTRVSPDVAILGLELAVSGQRRQPPGIQPTDTNGTLRTRMLYVLVHSPGSDAWEVVAAQNTAIVPAVTPDR